MEHVRGVENILTSTTLRQGISGSAARLNTGEYFTAEIAM